MQGDGLTDLQTYRLIFSQYSGISSHSIGCSYNRYVKTDSCNCDIDYHLYCLLQMKEKCFRQNKNMKCNCWQKQFFVIMDSENKNRSTEEENDDKGVCVIHATAMSF